MMNTIIELFKFACSGFWVFCGVSILLSITLHYFAYVVVKIFIRLVRLLTVSFRGWPPSHLDADGDFKTKL